jgi:hypothetical protein
MVLEVCFPTDAHLVKAGLATHNGYECTVVGSGTRFEIGQTMRRLLLLRLLCRRMRNRSIRIVDLIVVEQ